MRNLLDEFTWSVSEDQLEELKVGPNKNVQRLLRRMTRFFHRAARPTFVGPISTDMHLSLRQLQMLVDILVASGTIRPATIEERISIGAPPTMEQAIYVLPHGAEVWLAYD